MTTGSLSSQQFLEAKQLGEDQRVLTSLIFLNAGIIARGMMPLKRASHFRLI